MMDLIATQNSKNGSQKTNKPTQPTWLEKYGLSLNSILAVVAVGTTCFLFGLEYQKGRTSETTNAGSEEATVIPSAQETTTSTTTLSPASSANNSTSTTPTTGLININTASAAELDTLSGIGPTYAQAIINYRTTNGPFKKIEDIVNVKGIGEKTFEKFKDRITV